MAAVPAVELFTTSILSNHKVRHRHERYIAVFAAKRIDYVYHDLASDEDAKKRFRRKALDAQIPNILVHNEWRGTFEEFEESVEFGELDQFLRIDHSRADSKPPEVSNGHMAEAGSSVASSTNGTASLPSMSKLPPAPVAAPRMAPEGSGAGPKRNSMDDFLASLEAWKPQVEDMSEADITALLEEGESAQAKRAHESAPKAPKDSRIYHGASPLPKAEVKRTYFPTAEAGVRPLRLAKMGDDSRSVSTPAGSGPSSPSSSRNAAASPSSSHQSMSPNGSQYARFSASQNSSRALAAEASASASNRVFSAKQVRSALDTGQTLKDLMADLSSSRVRSRHDGRDEADSILEELGLADLKLTDEEAEAFLRDGEVPQGMELGGSRLLRGGTLSRKAREQGAARDVAGRAREHADERRQSAAMAQERRERLLQEEQEADEAAKRVSVQLERPQEMSSKAKEILERAKDKRASRQMALAQPLVRTEADLAPREDTVDESAEAQKGLYHSSADIGGGGVSQTDPASELRRPASTSAAEAGDDTAPAVNEGLADTATEARPEVAAAVDGTQAMEDRGGDDAAATLGSGESPNMRETSHQTDVEQGEAATVVLAAGIDAFTGESDTTSIQAVGEATPKPRYSMLPPDVPLPALPSQPSNEDVASTVAIARGEEPQEVMEEEREEEIDDLLQRLSGSDQADPSTLARVFPQAGHQEQAVSAEVDKGEGSIPAVAVDRSRAVAEASDALTAASGAQEKNEERDLPSPATSSNEDPTQSSPSASLPPPPSTPKQSTVFSPGSTRSRTTSSSRQLSPTSSRKAMDIRRVSSSSRGSAATGASGNDGLGMPLPQSPLQLSGEPQRSVPMSPQSSTSSSASFSALSTHSASPKSPKLKARLKSSFGSLRRSSSKSSLYGAVAGSGHGGGNSSSNGGAHGCGPEAVASPPLPPSASRLLALAKEQPSPPGQPQPLSPSSINTKKGSGGRNEEDETFDQNLRSQRTLSQILRDADAALAGADDEEDEGRSDDDGLEKVEIHI
ncbi:unnamed protein product [Jaminaea pallidilutea]